MCASQQLMVVLLVNINFCSMCQHLTELLLCFASRCLTEKFPVWVVAWKVNSFGVYVQQTCLRIAFWGPGRVQKLKVFGGLGQGELQVKCVFAFFFLQDIFLMRIKQHTGFFRCIFYHIGRQKNKVISKSHKIQ